MASAPPYGPHVHTIRNEVEQPRLFKTWPAYGDRNRVATAFVVATVPAAALRAPSQSPINAVDAAPGEDDGGTGDRGRGAGFVVAVEAGVRARVAVVVPAGGSDGARS